MSAWRRTFGLDGVETVIHFGVTLMLSIMGASILRQQEEVAVSAVWAGGLAFFAWRRRRALQALGDRPGTSGEVAAARTDELEERVANLEGELARMAELEERVDFAERLLLRQRPTNALAEADDVR